MREMSPKGLVEAIKSLYMPIFTIIRGSESNFKLNLFNDAPILEY